MEEKGLSKEAQEVIIPKSRLEKAREEAMKKKSTR